MQSFPKCLSNYPMPVTCQMQVSSIVKELPNHLRVVQGFTIMSGGPPSSRSNLTVSSWVRNLPFAASVLLVDVLHLPGVQRLEGRPLPLGTQRYTNAVLTAGIDTDGDTLSAVDKDFHDTPVDKHP